MMSLNRMIRRQCLKLYLVGWISAWKDMVKKILLFYELKKVTADSQELWQYEYKGIVPTAITWEELTELS